MMCNLGHPEPNRVLSVLFETAINLRQYFKAIRPTPAQSVSVCSSKLPRIRRFLDTHMSCPKQPLLRPKVTPQTQPLHPYTTNHNLYVSISAMKSSFRSFSYGPKLITCGR